MDCRRLCDPRKLRWKRRCDVEGPPDLAIMLLMDGSGSMERIRRETIEACTCIHEVLAGNDVCHAIAVHRTSYMDILDIDVLKDFDGPPMQKTNLLLYECRGDNRDGLALLWAERRLRESCPDADAYLMIVVSDGLPLDHNRGVVYAGESAKRDVRGIVDGMHSKGMEVIAIALGEDKSLYGNLTSMYRHVLACEHVSALPRRLFEILAKVLEMYRRGA